ncbi:hypothetical protein Tco_1148248, partial [Tanacetum coccineum]
MKYHPNPYSTKTQFGVVTDWYQEPSPFGGLSDIGSPGVDGPPVMPEDPYAYVFIPPEDDVLPTEEKPLSAAVSPTANSSGNVPDNDKDESSDDDEDDDVDIEGGKEEEEHPAPVDSTVVALPAVDHASSAEETEPFETDESVATPPPHLAYRVTARISIRDEPPTPFWSDTEVSRLLAIPTPPPSPLSPWSSPLPLAPPPHVSPTYPLGYIAAIIRLRAEALSTSYSPPPHIILSHTKADTPPSGTPPSGTPPLVPISLQTSSPSLLLTMEQTGPRPSGGFRADYGFVATMDREIMQDLERDVGYEITDTWEEM